MLSTSHAATVPTRAAAYFSHHPAGDLLADHRHPVVVAAFRPGKGWKRYPIRKHISPSWARKLLAEGYTDVTLSVRGVRADFSVRSLCR